VGRGDIAQAKHRCGGVGKGEEEACAARHDQICNSLAL
jgi:hypothetical protein